MKQFKGVIFALFITLSFVLTIGVLSSVAMMTINNAENHILLISGGVQLIYLVGVILILKLRKVKFSEKCGFIPVSPKHYILPCFAALSFSLCSNILQEILPIPQSVMGETTDMNGNNLIAFIAAIFIIAPVTEELVFRGLIVTKLLETVGILPAVIIGALLFGVIHLMTGSAVTGVHAFLGGLIFGLAYVKSKSLWVAIGAHFTGNIGGILSDLISELNFSFKITLAVIGGIMAVVICALLIRKPAEKVQV